MRKNRGRWGLRGVAAGDIPMSKRGICPPPWDWAVGARSGHGKDGTADYRAWVLALLTPSRAMGSSHDLVMSRSPLREGPWAGQGAQEEHVGRGPWRPRDRERPGEGALSLRGRREDSSLQSLAQGQPVQACRRGHGEGKETLQDQG